MDIFDNVVVITRFYDLFVERISFRLYFTVRHNSELLPQLNQYIFKYTFFLITTYIMLCCGGYSIYLLIYHTIKYT